MKEAIYEAIYARLSYRHSCTHSSLRLCVLVLLFLLIFVFSCIVYVPLNQSTTPPLVLPYIFVPSLLLAVWEAVFFPLRHYAVLDCYTIQLYTIFPRVFFSCFH